MDRTGTDPLSEILGFPEFVSELRLDEILDLIQEQCTRPNVFLDYGLGDSPFGEDVKTNGGMRTMTGRFHLRLPLHRVRR
ncbi:hypothetical protein MLD38_003454 [Melastoma candidum]|uniref:Uncharacterized protein n=1 Tax=Melastoma candidum TaxID=119954 RepID=A0ACB9S3Z0_9MYRT|nr:hypothetical protein MLD38_003454 [Melastoma candidum]